MLSIACNVDSRELQSITSKCNPNELLGVGRAMDADGFQHLKQCRRCGELRPGLGAMTAGICGNCLSEAPAQKLRKCSRCGLHKADWNTTAHYCPQCWREYQRERRAARKAEGLAVWSTKTCSRCQTPELMPPDNAWCRECRNRYQRHWKREHPNAHELPPQPPQPVTGREPLRTCSHCKRRLPYNRQQFKRGSICLKCWAGYREKAKQNEKAKFRLWRENAIPVECRTCGETKPYGRGWDGRLCPQCHSERMKKQYAEVKASPKRRKAQQEAARLRRQARAVQEAQNRGVSGVSGGVDTGAREGPENGPVTSAGA